MRRLPVSLALLLSATAPILHAQVVFPVTFDASASTLTSTERGNITAAVQAAGAHWMGVLGIRAARSIEVNIGVSSAPTANGTSNTSAAVGTIGGRTTYEQGVASELRTGVDPNGATADATITIGLDYLRNELWFDPDPVARTAAVPTNRTDAQSVFLHEFGHVLAYNGWADLNTGQPPSGYWSTFDRWMTPGSPTVIVGAYSVAAWGSPPALTTGNIDHWGNTAQRAAPWIAAMPRPTVMWRDGVPVPQAICELPMSVDAPLSRDSDAVETIEASLIDELMNGVVFYRGRRYDISALDRGLMTDVGVMVDEIFGAGFQ